MHTHKDTNYVVSG